MSKNVNDAIPWTHSPVAEKLEVALRAKLRKLFTFAIPWVHSPVASKLGLRPQTVEATGGSFHLME
ncbi:MAG: hypothetical protein IIZ93_10775 [Acidaminococcaceae bacterium]|nr:hypothetical protein [Acidaminococcaceae bacterium]